MNPCPCISHIQNATKEAFYFPSFLKLQIGYFHYRKYLIDVIGLSQLLYPPTWRCLLQAYDRLNQTSCVDF